MFPMFQQEMSTAVLELENPVFFDMAMPCEDSKIEFLAWEDPDSNGSVAYGIDLMKMESFSQDTAIPTLRITTAAHMLTNLTWDPPTGSMSLPFLTDDVYAQKRNKKTDIPKKCRKRKSIPKRVDFDKGTRSKSETGFRGVRFSTNGCRFRATVNVNKKPFNVGTFDTAKAAAEEYDKSLVRITQGRVERSRLNFPNMWNALYQHVRQTRSKDYVGGEMRNFFDTNEESEFVTHPAKRQKLVHW